MPAQLMWIVFFIFTGPVLSAFSAGQSVTGDEVAQLKSELKNKGWIAYSARSDNGSWDLFLMRPDGSQQRNITNTKDFEEAAPKFSWDGTKLLYRRLPKGTKISHDKWGFQGQLVIADSDGSKPTSVGKDKEYSWASWSPDAEQILCLTRKGIQIVDLATRQIVRQLPRQGIYQQLFWSPDGKWFTGTANHGGRMWRVVRMNAETGEVNLVSKTQSCTPDWFPNSRRIIYSNRPKDQKSNNGYGWTQLWMADGDGGNAQLIYGEEGYHIYGGEVSPDCRYVLFTKLPKDGGGPEESGAPIYVMRLSDAPTIHGKSEELRALHPNAKNGALLLLTRGWEPCWTFAAIGVGR